MGSLCDPHGEGHPHPETVTTESEVPSYIPKFLPSTLELSLSSELLRPGLKWVGWGEEVLD